MSEKSISKIIAEALRFYMGERWNNTTLGRAADVAPNTIKNCLAPEKRTPGKRGKESSPEVVQLQKIAKALGVQLTDLLVDATDEERRRIHRQRAAEYYQEHGKLPYWAPQDRTDQDKPNGTTG